MSALSQYLHGRKPATKAAEDSRFDPDRWQAHRKCVPLHPPPYVGGYKLSKCV